MKIYSENSALNGTSESIKIFLLKFDFYVFWLEFMDSVQSKHYFEDFQLV